MFKQTDIENQHVLFSNSLDIIFSHIDNPKVLEEYLSKLIEKHKKLGLTGEYTAYFADSFIAIKEIFPNDSDELIAEIWNKAISEIMSYFKIRLENKI